MRERDVIRLILKGLREGENADDVLYMCKTVAELRYERGQDFRRIPPRRNIIRIPGPTSRRTRLLYGAGLLLCPIFEPVKHENFRSQMEKMQEMRLQYKSISQNPQLKEEFKQCVLTGIDAGAFQSLVMANQQQLWRILQPVQSRPSGSTA